MARIDGDIFVFTLHRLRGQAEGSCGRCWPSIRGEQIFGVRQENGWCVRRSTVLVGDRLGSGRAWSAVLRAHPGWTVGKGRLSFLQAGGDFGTPQPPQAGKVPAPRLVDFGGID